MNTINVNIKHFMDHFKSSAIFKNFSESLTWTFTRIFHSLSFGFEILDFFKGSDNPD